MDFRLPRAASCVIRALPALAFALAVAPVPASANHCKGKHASDCPDGGTGGGGTVVFSVAVVGDPDASGRNTWLPTCTAQTPDAGGKLDATAIFPRHDLCAALTTSTGEALTDDIIVQVETARSGEILGVVVTGQDVIGEDGIAHKSDVLWLDSPVLPDAAGFTLHVHAENAAMWKCDTHRLMKKSNCVEWIGSFSLEDMIYSPDP